MKTLVLNSNNASIWKFDDDKVLDIQSDKIVVGEPAELYISDCNTSNVTLYENVTIPDDWDGHKYLFDGTTWSLNPSWTAPEGE